MEEFSKFKKGTGESTEKKPETTNGVTVPNTLPKEVESLIDESIGLEYTAYYLYVNATNWCKNMNYDKAAAYFEAEAASELEHSQGLQNYLVQWNMMPAIPSVATKHGFASLIDIINQAYALEYKLFEHYTSAQQELSVSHPATFNFIQKYLDIQNDSVAEYSDLLNALNLIDVNNKLDVLFFEKNYF